MFEDSLKLLVLRISQDFDKSGSSFVMGKILVLVSSRLTRIGEFFRMFQVACLPCTEHCKRLHWASTEDSHLLGPYAFPVVCRQVFEISVRNVGKHLAFSVDSLEMLPVK